MTRTHSMLVAAVATLTLFGCAAKNQQVASTPDDTANKTVQAPKSAAPKVEVRDEDDGRSVSFAPIRYELDSARLLPDSQETLRRLADHLRAHPRLSVQIAGHTCELGTAEYNFALGQQRAEAARKYLVNLGVESQRVQTLSFGEERPASHGRLEENRRSEFEIRLVGSHASL
jgi:peptidoglycan-associated lipoprotein